MSEEIGQAFSWDSPIDGAGDEYIIFNPGTYRFTVVGFKRGQFKGSAKMAASPMAVFTLQLSDNAGQQTVVTYNIILNQKMKRKLSEFFMGIGLLQENIGDGSWVPRWNEAAGATGYAVIGHREYNGTTYMDVQRVLKPSEFGSVTGAAQAPQAVPAQQAQTQQVQPNQQQAAPQFANPQPPYGQGLANAGFQQPQPGQFGTAQPQGQFMPGSF